MSSASPEVRLRTRVFTVITILVSLACLVWALHGVSWTELWQEIRELDWRWVAVAALTDVLVYVVQGWRWSLILQPVAPAPVRTSTRSIFVGLFANEVLPLRAGELIRCFLQARWTEIPFSVTLASALIERIFDGVVLIAGLFFSIRFLRHFPLTGGQHRAIALISDGSIALAVLLVVCGALLAVAMFWREQTLDMILDARMFAWAHVFIEDLHRIGHSRFLYFSFFVSIFFFLIQVVPTYAIMQAYGFESATWTQAAVLTVLLRLASVVPQAPGNVGLFQLISTLGLTLFGLPRGMAGRFTLILWGVITLPLLIVGFIALVASGAKMGDIQREARAEMRARQDELTRS